MEHDSAQDGSWAPDVSALLTLPALWVDREPREIANGLLSVLFGVLRLDSAYARLADAGRELPIEVWRPAGVRPPGALTRMLRRVDARGAEIVVVGPEGGEAGSSRVVALPVALPWENGIVAVSAPRPDFPTATERKLLTVAVGQAAIAIHAARRLEQETAARRAAEDALLRQQELLRALSDEVAPELAALARTVRDAGRPRTAAVPSGPLGLTEREAEVLRLLAQGLRNKEIASRLCIAEKTVKNHVSNILKALQVNSRTEAAMKAVKTRLVEKP